MLDHMDPVTLPNIYATEAALKFPNMTSPPSPDQNPLRDVEVPGTSTSDFPLLKTCPSPPSRMVSIPVADKIDFPNTEAPEAKINPNIEIIKCAAAPPAIYSVRPLSTRCCPPSLALHEWTHFIAELERAAAIFMRRKTFAVAVGVTTSDSIIPGTITWGMWRYLAANTPKTRSNIDLPFDPKSKRESVAVVVARWNDRWADRGVKVALEVKSKKIRKAKGQQEKSVMIFEDEKMEAVGNGDVIEIVEGVYHGGFEGF